MTNHSLNGGLSKLNIVSEANVKWKKQADEINLLLSKCDSKRLFTDPFFMPEDPNNNIIENQPGATQLEWLRPKEICKSPVLGTTSTGYVDVIQGNLDDCSFISACSSICKYSYLLRQIFPDDLNLGNMMYKGAVRVNFYINNEWVGIYVDDRLPCLNKKLHYAKNKNENNFWAAIIEKAYAKVKGSYSNIVSLDSASCLIELTGGFVLRLNPTHVNDGETIMNYLSECKEGNFFVGIAGCELSKNDETQQISINKPITKSGHPRVGHAFSLVDTIFLPNKNKAFIKMYNVHPTMKLDRKYNENDRKMLEAALKIMIPDESQTTYFTYEEFFDFFEIFNLLVIPKDKLPDGQDLTFFGKWEDRNNLVATRTSSLIEKYLNSPHFVFEIKNNDKKSNEQIVLIMNILIENFNANDFVGYFALPIFNREGLEGPGTNFYFVNYSIQNQTLSNMNPVTKEIKLLPGRYLFGLIIQSKNLKDFKTKHFNLRVATSLNTTITQQNFIQTNENDNNYLVIEKTKEKIKLVLAKCCVCEYILDASFITSGPKTFCLKCYNQAFRCEQCNSEVGKDYYTIEQRIFCETCCLNLAKEDA